MGMSLIVKKVTQFVIAIIFVFGINIVLFGHLTPGGGFAGGVILACGFILIMIAFGKEIALRKVRKHIGHILDSGAALMFLALAMLGYAGGIFFFNFINQGNAFYLRSAGFIPLENIAIGIKVSASVFIGFVTLVLFGRWVDESISGSDEN